MAGESTRAAIAEAAAQEFLAHGYAGASLSAIAERRGLTKGALSYHFRAKADFASHFLSVVRAATAQADAFAKAEYPDSGARRLLLYFLAMSSWRATEAQYAAGIALFTDSASPAFEADEVIRAWRDLSVEAFSAERAAGRLGGRMSPLEAAELFLIINLGAVFFGAHVRAGDPSITPLRFVRHGLTAVGVPDADRLADEVIARHRDALPALACLSTEHG